MKRDWHFRISRLLLPLGLLLAHSLAGAQSPEKLKSLLGETASRNAALEAGKKASTFCSNCHGVDGNSKLSEVPNLAGQNPVYLLNQVHKFYTGERKDQWMEPAIKLLSEAERLNITVYYSQMAVIPASNAPLNKTGQALYQKVCVRCHGDKAYGGERFPRLAGQQHTYLIRSLTRYRDRTGNRMEPEMLAMTAALKDEDIKALADYLSALH